MWHLWLENVSHIHQEWLLGWDQPTLGCSEMNLWMDGWKLCLPAAGTLRSCCWFLRWNVPFGSPWFEFFYSLCFMGHILWTRIKKKIRGWKDENLVSHYFLSLVTRKSHPFISTVTVLCCHVSNVISDIDYWLVNLILMLTSLQMNCFKKYSSLFSIPSMKVQKTNKTDNLKVKTLMWNLQSCVIHYN